MCAACGRYYHLNLNLNLDLDLYGGHLCDIPNEISKGVDYEYSWFTAK